MTMWTHKIQNNRHGSGVLIPHNLSIIFIYHNISLFFIRAPWGCHCCHGLYVLVLWIDWPASYNEIRDLFYSLDVFQPPLSNFTLNPWLLVACVWASGLRVATRQRVIRFREQHPFSRAVGDVTDAPSIFSTDGRVFLKAVPGGHNLCGILHSSYRTYTISITLINVNETHDKAVCSAAVWESSESHSDFGDIACVLLS